MMLTMVSVSPPPDLADLRREAARSGPGLRGERRLPTDRERLDLARRFAILGEAAPAYVLQGAEWVDRRAKLFEMGEFPERSLSVGSDDLDRLAASFEMPIPVLIEHADSPLQLGYVTAVEREGSELFGTVALTREADALVRASGAGFLSVGVAPDLSRLVEVSLVRRPRVADARLFGAEEGECPLRFHAALPEASEASPEMESELARLVREGRLAPTEVEAARSLLLLGRGRFDARGEPIAETLIALLERRSPSPLLFDLAPATFAGSDPAPLMTPAERAFYHRHFPDLPLGEIARRARPQA